MKEKKSGLLSVPNTVPFNNIPYQHTAQVLFCADSPANTGMWSNVFNKVLRALGTISVEGLGDLLSESMFLYRILLQVTPLQ